MVRKLMADNFREIWRYWSGIGLPAIFVMFISLALYSLNLPVVSSLAFVAAILATVVTVLSLPLILVLSYYRSLYSAEGYLAHTLPVRGRDLYLSKVATAFSYLLIDLLLTFVLLAAINMAMDLNSRQPVFTGLRTLFDSFAALDHKLTYITVFTAYIIFTFFMMITQFAFVISKGSEAGFHRIGLGGPVVVYLITYVTQQVLSLVGMIALPLGIHFGVNPDGSMSDIKFVFRSSLESFTAALRGEAPTDFTMGLGFALLLLALGVVYIALTIRSLEKHTSLR